MNDAISARTTELREQVTADPPAGLAGLGTRPTEPRAAASWDELAGMAAAFRETYKITSDDSGAPLGRQPESAGAKTRAWQDIVTHWRPPMTTDSDDLRAENQRDIEALQNGPVNEVMTGRAEREEDVAEFHSNLSDEAEILGNGLRP